MPEKPKCEHCGHVAGENQRSCWWCIQHKADELLSITIDSWFQRGENALAFIPGWLMIAQRQNGVFF
jgi:hypothetical protein